MEKFRYIIEDLKKSVLVNVLNETESRELIVEYDRLKEREPNLTFRMFILDSLIHRFKEAVLPVITRACRGEERLIHVYLENLFSLCLDVNPILSLMAIDYIASALFADKEPELGPEEDPQVIAEEEHILKQNVPRLQDYLLKNVVGQDEAIKQVFKAFKRASVGFSDTERPICSFILAGCSGVGKTLLVKEINNCLFENQPLIRIDCSEFQQEHEYAKLIGCFSPGVMVGKPGGASCPIEKVQEGQYVLDGWGNPAKVLRTHAYPYNGEVVEINMVGDIRKIMCTPEHKIYGWDDEANKWTWKEARTLRQDDWLFFPHNKAGPGIGLDDMPFNMFCNIHLNPADAQPWEVLGWFASRGKVQNSGSLVKFTFFLSEGGIQKHLMQLIEHSFPIRDALLNLDEDAVVLVIDSLELAYFIRHFMSFFPDRSLGAHFIEGASREQIISFLVGAFGIYDGNLGETKNPLFATRSDSMVSQMRLLSAKVGYMPHISKLRRSAQEDLAFCLSLPWTNYWNLAYELKSGRQRKQDVSGFRHADNGSFLQIEKVASRHYIGEVYDLSVEGHASYTVNSVTVHNSPPGYKDSDRDGYLTGQLKRYPRAIVLIDEIEKANKKLFDLFLQILGEGRITDNKGEVVDCSRAAFFFTTNLGNDYKRGSKLGFGIDKVRETGDNESYVNYVTAKIKQHFRIELLGRINGILVFNRLSEDNYLKIVNLELAKVRKRLRRCGPYTLKVTMAAKRQLAREGASDEWGARRIVDVIRDRVEDPIADYLIEKDPSRCTFTISWSKGEGFKLENKGGEKGAD